MNLCTLNLNPAGFPGRPYDTSWTRAERGRIIAYHLLSSGTRSDFRGFFGPVGFTTKLRRLRSRGRKRSKTTLPGSTLKTASRFFFPRSIRQKSAWWQPATRKSAEDIREAEPPSTYSSKTLISGPVAGFSLTTPRWTTPCFGLGSTRLTSFTAIRALPTPTVSALRISIVGGYPRRLGPTWRRSIPSLEPLISPASISTLGIPSVNGWKDGMESRRFDSMWTGTTDSRFPSETETLPTKREKSYQFD